MDKMIIKGGGEAQGEVEISGAKNAALPILVSSLLTKGWNTFHNIPDLDGYQNHQKTAPRSFGAEMEGTKTVRINAKHISSVEAPYDLVKTMRASVLVLGPLVARWAEARVSLPGGCAIGARPVNLHIKALEEMGADSEPEGRLDRGDGLPPERRDHLFRYHHRYGDGKYHDGGLPGQGDDSP